MSLKEGGAGRFAGDAEKKAEEYMSNGPYTGPLSRVKMPASSKLRSHSYL